MSSGDKVKHAAEQAKGKAKEVAGAATGNEDLQHEGQADQAEAHAAHKADQAKDSAKHAGEEVKGKAKEVVGAVSGDDGMEAEGKGDQVAAKVKERFNK